MMSAMVSVVALNVRLPAELHAALTLCAQEHGHSLQREIVGVLQVSLSDGVLSASLHEEVRRMKCLAEQLRARVEMLEARSVGRAGPQDG